MQRSFFVNGTVYQVTSDTVSNNELGSYIGILAENVIFNAETKFLCQGGTRKLTGMGKTPDNIGNNGFTKIFMKFMVQKRPKPLQYR